MVEIRQCQVQFLGQRAAVTGSCAIIKFFHYLYHCETKDDRLRHPNRHPKCLTQLDPSWWTCDTFVVYS